MSAGSPTPSTTVAVAALLALVATSAGCATKRGAGSTSFHDERMDFSLVHTVAVLPFANLSGVQPAAERVRETFMTALQSAGAVYVVPPGEVARGIDRLGLRTPSAPAPEEVVGLSRALETDAVFTGTVLEYGEARSGSATANFISISVKMLEAETGRVVWSASTSHGGVGAKERLLGGGGRAMNEVTLDAVNDLLKRLFE
jgi:hypothetical protein